MQGQRASCSGTTMSDQAKPLTPAEQDLIGQVARLAERRAVNGVYMVNGVSKSLGMIPICFVVALGEQAQMLNDIIMRAQARDPNMIEVVSNFDEIDITGNGRKSY